MAGETEKPIRPRSASDTSPVDLSDAEVARGRLRDLGQRRARGDVDERTFRRQLLDESVGLARAEARAVLEPDEAILAEHHVVHSHFKLTESLLREPEQSTVSLFATARRLVRVRGTLSPSPTGIGEEATRAQIDQIKYEATTRLEKRVERRWGEVGTGLAIVLLALLLRRVLAITGPVLVLLGVAGALHGLLLPTRWIEIASHAEIRAQIHCVWRRSARRLVAVVHQALAKRTTDD